MSAQGIGTLDRGKENGRTTRDRGLALTWVKLGDKQYGFSKDYMMKRNASEGQKLPRARANS